MNTEPLLDQLRRLREFAESFARCPCCDAMVVCLSGCTFRKDCPNDWETMVRARLAIYGRAARRVEGGT